MDDNTKGSMINIRKAERKDCQSIRDLIQELADYEKMSDGPRINAQTLERDGFGDHPYFYCFVAETLEGHIVGYVLYFYTYSTWEGKSIYMEDLYVSPQYRLKKIGTKLWGQVVKTGLDIGCTRCNFAVLDWNTPSIDFYKAAGAVNLTSMEGWQMFRMDHTVMKQFVEKLNK